MIDPNTWLLVELSWFPPEFFWVAIWFANHWRYANDL
jgi:hypothetical protein